MNPTNKMRPIHPGEILREEYLVPMAMSAHALALALRVPAPRINEIVRERRAITPDTAVLDEPANQLRSEIRGN
jgi:addiction module HigA family antidote